MLSINSIELFKFQGMWLNKIKYFKLDDIKRYQLILGRNGCGKSRLIRILSLIAPSKTDFEVSGYRTLHITKDGVQYKLHCLRTKTAFKCTIVNLTDDEVLYDAVNPTVYNTAIKELFNYDKDVHDLVTGKVLFTNMRTPDRKKWFSILSESDLTYALSFYKKSREHLRDFTGAIKTIKHNIGILQPKVIENKDELKETKNRILSMQQEITLLDKEINTTVTDYNVTEDTLQANERRLDRVNRNIFATDVRVKPIVKQYTQLDVQTRITEQETTHNLKMSELGELTKKVEHNSKVMNIDLHKLEDIKNDLQAKVDSLKSSLVLFKSLPQYDVGTLETASKMFEYYAPLVNNALNELSNVDDPTDVDAKVRAYTEQVNQSGQAIYLRKNALASLEANLIHIEEAHTVDCTKCGHKFKPGIGDNDKASILAKMKKIETELVTIKEYHEDHKEQLLNYTTAANACTAAYHSSQSCGGNDATGLLFSRLVDENYLHVNKPHLNAVVNKFKTELDSSITLLGLQVRLDKVTLDMEIIKANQSEDYTELNARVSVLNAQLVDIAKNKAYWQSVLAVLKEAAQRITYLSTLSNELTCTLEENDAILSALAGNEAVGQLNRERDAVWDLLITTKQRFEDMDRERIRLEDLERDLVSTLARRDATHNIVEALSPDGGILAKYLYQSITKVTDLMTGYINSIWGYEMGVMPCAVNGNELDYKFPFYANDATQVTEDISLGSKAQQEVINFVFMLSVYQAMGLEGYPLFLDELGSGFDEGHKPSMIDFIKGLIERGYHSQVFMVSHDPDTHFQLSHADVCVIDQNGITLPAVYNKNVTITN